MGVLLGILYLTAMLDAKLGGRSAVMDFSSAAQSPDESLWSAARVQAFITATRLATNPPIALLRIPSLRLVVPLYATASALHLNRGVGLIERMAHPGEGGNLGIAGHRDGFFRALQDIARGDLIEVQTHQRTYRYRVVATQVVAAGDTTPLADTAEPTVTLVTCYPFYYLGPRSPDEFVVREAIYKRNNTMRASLLSDFPVDRALRGLPDPGVMARRVRR